MSISEFSFSRCLEMRIVLHTSVNNSQFVVARSSRLILILCLCALNLAVSLPIPSIIQSLHGLLADLRVARLLSRVSWKVEVVLCRSSESGKWKGEGESSEETMKSRTRSVSRDSRRDERCKETGWYEGRGRWEESRRDGMGTRDDGDDSSQGYCS